MKTLIFLALLLLAALAVSAEDSPPIIVSVPDNKPDQQVANVDAAGSNGQADQQVAAGSNDQPDQQVAAGSDDQQVPNEDAEPEEKTAGKSDETPGADDDVSDTDEIIKKIGKMSKDKKFKAKSYEEFRNKPNRILRKYLGVAGNPGQDKKDRLLRQGRSKRQTYVYPPNFSAYTYPANFDVSWKWPQCDPVMKAIQHQGLCGSCWAVSSAQVITDRRCIYFNATTLQRTSAWDIVSCCQTCQVVPGDGCSSGYPYKAFEWYKNTGVVTGGDNPSIGTSIAYCKPYPYKPTDPEPTSTPCSTTCQSGYTARTYSVDKRVGSNYFVVDYDNNAVMWELINRGPVVAQLEVYNDFYTYQSGIYRHLTGNLTGYHAVKLVGWGVDAAGTKYWKAANSWGTGWGEQGYFRILRGVNECKIEYFDAFAGVVQN